ncbi:MAG: hypothetical protein IKZ58_07865 [Selenomonadaceae bacterium]|nr:hypothetical protein [Selenomonadaceae bacterium]
MAEIIFGYKCSPVFIHCGVSEEFYFNVYSKGTVRYKTNIIGSNFSESKVIESKKIIIPMSVVEDLKKILIEQKNLIDKLPKNIDNLSDDGAYHDFNFLGKKISCLNISQHDLDENSEAKILLSENSHFYSSLKKTIMEQENNVLKIFESVYNILKNYGLKVYSWKYFCCDWEME